MEEKLINFLRRPAVMRSIYLTCCMVISFALGIASEYALMNKHNNPVIQIPEKPIPLAYLYKAPVNRNQLDITPAIETTSPDTTATTADSSAQAFVASKTGKNYYPQGCAGIDRIKVENRIYFATEKDAQEKGYTKSVSCK